ncbi:hypothetical protein NRY95_03660 [Xanthomonas campestris pv. phormiicola]|nr:hypothetical protein [Xanthomonas campestris pv. phormiicola]UYC17078.1 hypothetical protein NRY95_03660 [Xanthomonas campestris pv. phormiicola]
MTHDTFARREATQCVLVDFSRSLGKTVLLATGLMAVFLLARDGSGRPVWMSLVALDGYPDPGRVHGQLLLWYVLALACRTAQVGYVCRYVCRALRIGLSEACVRRVVGVLAVVGALESATWAMLVEIALQNAYRPPLIMTVLIVLVALGNAHVPLLATMQRLSLGMILLPCVLIAAELLARARGSTVRSVLRRCCAAWGCTGECVWSGTIWPHNCSGNRCAAAPPTGCETICSSSVSRCNAPGSPTRRCTA